MGKKTGICIGVIVIILLLYAFGSPDEINVFGAKWCIKNCDKQLPPIVINNNNEDNTVKSEITPLDLITISDLKSRQNIYSPEDQAIVDFNIKDDKNIPYNLTVYWFFNETRYHGWYNESNKTQPFYAWFTTNKKGVWNVQVLLKWSYNNKTYSKDETTKVTVR